MSKIISIQNSGESLEKCISLYNSALKSDINFYTNNELYVFYGHNLNKKEKNINPHGTIGFYEEYYSNYDWCPIKGEQHLLIQKKKFLEELNENGIISKRVKTKLYDDQLRYLKFIRNLPIDILFPIFTDKLIKKIQKIFPNVHFKKIYLERDLMRIFSSLPEEKWAYSVYALNTNGTIGHYFFNICQNEFYERKLYHLFQDLSNKPVLSGNSATFLATIKDYMRNSDYAIGFRMHSRESRATRDFALRELIKDRKKIIEPKNSVFNNYFEKLEFKGNISMEKKANLVIAKAFEDFINEYDVFS